MNAPDADALNVCVMKGCDLPVLTLHLCNKHWRRLRKYGSPAAMRSQGGLMVGLPAEERFARQVRRTPSCWLWAGPTDQDGYGVFRGAVGGATYTKAHRFSLALAAGKPLPPGMVVMHTCDNPRCVNPGHLRLGTTRENILDKFAKGRACLPKGALIPRVALTPGQRRAVVSDPRPNSQVAVDYGINASEVTKVREQEAGKGVPIRSEASTELCAIKNCAEPAAHLGLCADHWRRCAEFGAPTIDKPHFGKWVALPARDRLMAQVRKDKGCWMWTGSTDKDGYGRIRAMVGGVEIRKAHTLSYTLQTGELVPTGMVVMHTCDRPGCVNPEHLRVGTYKENSRDMHAKGRANIPEGENAPTAVLTEAQVHAIALDARTYEQIAKDYGVKASTIGSIKQRVFWKGVKIDKIVKAKKIGMRGETQWQAKLTEDNVREIRTSGLTGKELAAKFGVTPQAITNIRKRRIWKHVE